MEGIMAIPGHRAEGLRRPDALTRPLRCAVWTYAARNQEGCSFLTLVSDSGERTAGVGQPSTGPCSRPGQWLVEPL